MAFYIGEIRRMRNEFFDAYRDGDYKKAIILGKGILNIYIENEDCDSMDYAVDMSNLAMAFDQVQIYDRALELYKKAAELKKDYSGESLSYADTLNNMAIVLNQMGKQKEALSLHNKVLEIRDAKLGREHMDYIHSLYHMGNTYELLQEQDKAIECHNKAMQRARQCKEFTTLDLADLHGAAVSFTKIKGHPNCVNNTIAAVFKTTVTMESPLTIYTFCAASNKIASEMPTKYCARVEMLIAITSQNKNDLEKPSAPAISG